MHKWVKNFAGKNLKIAGKRNRIEKTQKHYRNKKDGKFDRTEDDGRRILQKAG